MLFSAIDHSAIACCDVQKQIDWYCANLGMKLIASNGKKPLGALVGYGQGARSGAMIELMAARDAGAEPSAIPRFAPGVRHVALCVADFDRAYAQLKSAGVEFLGEPAPALGGGRIISFRDPEGNELQIVERP
jgi:glyoxylase I family protein